MIYLNRELFVISDFFSARFFGLLFFLSSSKQLPIPLAI